MKGERTKGAYPRPLSQTNGDTANTDSGADGVWPKLLQIQQRRAGITPTAHVEHGHYYLCSAGHGFGTNSTAAQEGATATPFLPTTFGALCPGTSMYQMYALYTPFWPSFPLFGQDRRNIYYCASRAQDDY